MQVANSHISTKRRLRALAICTYDAFESEYIGNGWFERAPRRALSVAFAWK